MIKEQEQYATFVEERPRTNTRPITATITRNKVVLFNVQAQRFTKSGDKVNLLKRESSLFARLYYVHLHGTQEILLPATTRKQIPGLWCTLLMLLCRPSTRSLFERRTVDTDVVVMAVAVVQQLAQTKQNSGLLLVVDRTLQWRS